jgi:hypothetical protein
MQNPHCHVCPSKLQPLNTPIQVIKRDADPADTQLCSTGGCSEGIQSSPELGSRSILKPCQDCKCSGIAAPLSFLGATPHGRDESSNIGRSHQSMSPLAYVVKLPCLYKNDNLHTLL